MWLDGRSKGADDARATGRGGTADVEGGPDHARAISHDLQADAAVLRGDRVEAASVVLDREHDVRADRTQDDPDVRRLAVPQRIRERFLCDAEQVGGDVAVAEIDRPARLELALNGEDA